VRTERIERAIADDLAFLASHLTRRKASRKAAGAHHEAPAPIDEEA
jgi:hypothetical protein